MHPGNFEELTRRLAEARSRRAALRTIIAAAVGGLFGLGGITTAFARRRVNYCARWCGAVFGPNTAAAAECTRQAAHHTGPCWQCGSHSDVTAVCCTRDS